MLPILAFLTAVLAIASTQTGERKTSAQTGPRRVTRSGALVDFTQADGRVLERPSDLWKLAQARLGRSLSQSAFALAVMIASEAGDAPSLAKIAVAWATKNAAKRRGLPIWTLLVPHGYFASTYYYGNRGLRYYAAMSRPPTASDVEIAEGVIAGRLSDPTKGADQFDSPGALAAAWQRRLAGDPVYASASNPETVERNRIAAGKVPVYVPGVSPQYLRLWRPATV
jgi:hypothetical protein